ncbi:MAG: VWA domain-containing protein [Pseudomonadales bacterium]|nr:VWA domain-containing protein [Pseudomonadales bacterium]
MLLVDMSGSLDFGSAHRSKREAAVELSALLAFSAIYNDDKVGLLLFHRGVDEYIPPRKGQKHALRVVREVLARGREETDEARRQRHRGTFARIRNAPLPRRFAVRFANLLGRGPSDRRGPGVLPSRVAAPRDPIPGLRLHRRRLPGRAVQRQPQARRGGREGGRSARVGHGERRTRDPRRCRDR